MKRAVDERVHSWLLATGRDDLLIGEVEVPDRLYDQVLAEAKEQHPEQPTDLLEDRALYRILTHPEWTPLAKDSSGLTETKDSPAPVLYRMMGAAAESAKGAASSATIAALQCGMALQHAERAELAESRGMASSQVTVTASQQAQLAAQLACSALEEYSRIAKRQM